MVSRATSFGAMVDLFSLLSKALSDCESRGLGSLGEHTTVDGVRSARRSRMCGAGATYPNLFSCEVKAWKFIVTVDGDAFEEWWSGEARSCVARRQDGQL